MTSERPGTAPETVETNRSKRILVVEDDEDAAMLAADALESEGMVVETAHTGSAALAKDLSSFGVILLDYNLPDGLGVDFLKQMVDRTDTPVVMVTGEDSVDTAVTAIQEGAFDYILKVGDYVRTIPLAVEKTLEAWRIRKRKEELEQTLRETNQRLEQELLLARRVQRKLMPEIPKLPGVDVAYRTLTSSYIGGDLVDLFALADGSLGFFLGDVTGHGPSAALLSSMLKMFLHSGDIDHGDPERVIRLLNENVRKVFPLGWNLTAIYGVLDPKTSRATWIRAGHTRPVWVHDGRPEEVESAGPLLGALPAPQYEVVSKELGPGGRLILYTDGLIEERGDRSREVGLPRLIQSFMASGTCDEVADAIVSALKEFTGHGRAEEEGDWTSDDVTVLVIGTR